MASASRVLVAPAGVSGGTTGGHTITAAACTSLGRVVDFCLERAGIGKGVELLHLRTSDLETPDPYGGPPILSFPEVVCVDGALLLLRLRSTHPNYPTDYFVYGHGGGQRGPPWAVLVPEVVPELLCAGSVGLLRAPEGDCYVVANLRQGGQEGAFLDLFYSNKESGWIQDPIALPLPVPEGEEWHTDQVVAVHNSLLWVDLKRGILLCPNLFGGGGGKDPKLEYVPFPPELRPGPADRRGRSVACCDGDVKLVDLQTSQAGAAAGKVAVWTLKWDLLAWEEEHSKMLDYPALWSDMRANCYSLLPPWEELGNHTPCCPVLMSGNLYLTVAGGDDQRPQAWLLQFDVQTWTLNDIADYSPFFHHDNPPFPGDLSNYLNSWPGDDPYGGNHPIVHIDGVGLQVDEQLVMVGVAS